MNFESEGLLGTFTKNSICVQKNQRKLVKHCKTSARWLFDNHHIADPFSDSDIYPENFRELLNVQVCPKVVNSYNLIPYN